MMITRDMAAGAGHGRVFHHATLRNSDGTAVRCRVSGRCKLWKTRPRDFLLPVKYGLKECFYLTPDNAADWLDYDPTDAADPKNRALVR